jgi:hypothetical protein
MTGDHTQNTISRIITKNFIDACKRQEKLGIIEGESASGAQWLAGKAATLERFRMAGNALSVDPRILPAPGPTVTNDVGKNPFDNLQHTWRVVPKDEDQGCNQNAPAVQVGDVDAILNGLHQTAHSTQLDHTSSKKVPSLYPAQGFVGTVAFLGSIASK